MLRLIAVMLASIFAISILRSVIGLILKTFASMVAPNLPKSGPQPSTSETPAVAGELKKDPVCGTYVLATTAVKKISAGETVYFCSADCRDKHAV